MAGKFQDIPEATSRFSDFISEPQGILPPIKGYEEKSLVSLEETVEPLRSLVPDVDQMVWTVKSSCCQLKDGLSSDESASIMLYSLEWSPPERPFFDILNETLRSRERRRLIPWFSYLRLFVHALSKLPPTSNKVIYRGINMHLTDDFSENNEFFWWGFSSCTSSLSVLENYIGKSGKRTIFNITFHTAKDIARHSYYPDEKEVLFYPARQFKVRSSLNAGNDLHIIELEETEPPFSLFRMPSIPSPVLPAPPPPTDRNINILLLGEQGVGKSTFINAFVNYLTFKTVEEARSNRLLVLKPLSFVVTSNDTFEARTIQLGDFDHRDQSKMQRCHTYTYNLNQTDGQKLCLIDTPSFTDALQSDQVISNNIKHILEYVNNLTHLNAVCLLLQPDSSRLLDSFQSGVAQVLTRLDRHARKNVIFCFTNALIAFSMPGSTAPLVRKMFATHSMNDISFSRDNTFFFENEAFRYLIAVRNAIRFNEEDKGEYTSTWSESVNESKRLLNYIRTQLTPYRFNKM